MAQPSNRPYLPVGSLVGRLAAGTDWRAYVEHEFVRQLGQGTLPEACFRHYLGQDYLFLIHFARAYALAVYKSETLAEMRHAAEMVKALIDVEMHMHVEFCAGWGLDEAGMAALPEATATMAYTRYVLERGQSGDLLDLYAALAPCVIGYGEIGARLADGGGLDGNPYRAWIEMYAGPEYQDVARAAIAQLDRLGAERLTEGRFASLARTFDQATRLEVGFWRMGLGLES
jgi:thiaminase/transcriptional activator TenA